MERGIITMKAAKIMYEVKIRICGTPISIISLIPNIPVMIMATRVTTTGVLYDFKELQESNRELNYLLTEKFK